MKESLKILAITLLSFLVYFVLDEQFFRDLRQFFWDQTGWLSFSHILAYFIFGAPLFVGTMLIASPNRFFEALGLNKSILKGAGLALLFTLPMFVGYALVFDFKGIDVDNFMIGAASAGFFEELYFRAFLFGMIYRFTKFGFFPSIIIGAVWFGSVHLYQSQELGMLIGIFLTTFMGAFLFAWLYSEWKFNLWVPIFMHFFMNLSWMLFAVADDAFGNTWGNVFRYSTVAFAIIFTVVYKLQNGQELEINRKTLWIKDISQMASITPIVRQSSWFLAIPQFVVLGIFMLLWYPISPESFWGLGALCYLVISKVLRFYIPKDHREGLKKVKLQKFDEAIPHFQKSYDYFKLHYWIDSYRSIVLLSSSRMCYKEMALNNIGFCYGQIGNGEMAKKYYELTLLEFPESEIAKTALRFMNSVSSS